MKKLFYIDIYGYIATSRFAGSSKFVSSYEDAVVFLYEQSKRLLVDAHCKKITFSIFYNNTLHYEGMITESANQGVVIKYTLYEGVLSNKKSTINI